MVFDGNKMVHFGQMFYEDASKHLALIDSEKEIGNGSLNQNIAPLGYPGFFFGNDEIDKYYWEEVKSTIIQLKDLLEEDNKSASFYYRSSW